MIYASKHFIVIHATAQKFVAWDSKATYEKEFKDLLIQIQSKLYHKNCPQLEWNATGIQTDDYSCGDHSLLRIFSILQEYKIKQSLQKSPREWVRRCEKYGFLYGFDPMYFE